MVRVLVQVGGHAVGAGEGDQNEVESLLQAVVRFGATEPQKAAAGIAEALAAQAGDAEAVVGSFQQVERQSRVRDNPSARAGQRHLPVRLATEG